MGKHSVPSKTRPRLIKIGTSALAATTMPLLVPSTANAEETSILEAIAQCESGMQNIPTRGNSTASGYLQILDSTWKAFGGTTVRAMHASKAEQFRVGANVLAGQGLAAWSESKGCWGKKVGSLKTISTPKTPKPAPKVTPKSAPKTTPKPTPKSVEKAVSVAAKPKPKIYSPPTKKVATRAAKSYLIKRGDTLSEIALGHHTTWRKLFNANRDTVKNPNLIYTGNHLRLT